MAEILEVVMIICFGASWPFNVVRSYKARTAKCKSPVFLCLIILGYIAGITSKFMNEAYMASFSEKWYVLFFYFLNLIMVAVDFALYLRNRRLDRLSEQQEVSLLISSPSETAFLTMRPVICTRSRVRTATPCKSPISISAAAHFRYITKTCLRASAPIRWATTAT